MLVSLVPVGAAVLDMSRGGPDRGFSKMTGPQDADVVELVNTPATEKNAGVRETRSHDPAF